ncbi:MAG TPA: biopolymer transporter ExbD [Candidatus Marinimicrobia bacterium]|nr:biopolymer transporter ExbD [Candidatus Neomarinimicrobiota bacterium]
MLVKKKKRRPSGEINSGSMSDIAFLLLVFFLLVSTVDQDKGIGVVLPGEGGETQVSKKNITNVMVNAAGQVLFNDEIIQIREINKRAQAKEIENPNMIFSVQTDSKTKYQVYVDVIDQLKQANVKRISIANTE